MKAISDIAIAATASASLSRNEFAQCTTAAAAVPAQPLADQAVSSSFTCSGQYSAVASKPQPAVVAAVEPPEALAPAGDRARRGAAGASRSDSPALEAEDAAGQQTLALSRSAAELQQKLPMMRRWSSVCWSATHPTVPPLQQASDAHVFAVPLLQTG